MVSKTWGPSVLRALTVYKAVIRSVILYRASTYVISKDRQGRGSTLLRQLMKEQNDCLRKVTGAYGTTPVAVLEDLIGCPPINLAAAARVASFEISTAPTKAWQTAWERTTLLIQSRRRGRRRLTLPDPMRGEAISVNETW